MSGARPPDSMPPRCLPDEPGPRKARLDAALTAFVARLERDKTVLAAVLVGSLDEPVVWRRESIGMWIVEADGVSRRHVSDGKDERVFRTLVEDDINIHAELIPRSRFKQMVEGASRTAFRHNFFARRELVYCADESIARWFDDADRVASRDQDKELLVVTSWVVHAHRNAERMLHVRGDRLLAAQEVLGAAWGLAALEVIRHGEVFEGEIIDRGRELAPELFATVYGDVVTGLDDRQRVAAAIERVDRYLDDHAERDLRPLLELLTRLGRAVPLSEIGDHFAHSQLYPFHLESACEWLARKGKLEKLATPYVLTRRSRIEVEEPAYFYDGSS